MSGQLGRTARALIAGLAVLAGLWMAPERAPAGTAAGLPEASAWKPGKIERDDAGRLTLDQRPLLVCPQGLTGRDCDYRSIARALREARNGDVFVIAAGIYREAAVLLASGVTIRAEPGAHMTGVAAEGKAALVIRGNDTVIEGLECSRIAVRDRNGACIRLEADNLTLRGVYFHDSEQGLLGGREGVVLIEDSLFERLGAGGQAHGMYIAGGKALIVRRSRILSSRGEGHEIKSRAARTIVTDSVIASLGGVDSRLIDAPNGGEVVVRDSVLQIGPNSSNRQMIGVGHEGLKYETNSVLITGNVIVADLSPSTLLAGLVAGEISGNVLVGGRPIAGNRWFRNRRAAGLPPYPALPEPGVSP